MSGLIRVLHVTDEPEVAEKAAHFLEREDTRLTVETATTASEGLDRLADINYDCLVTPSRMPGQTGIEFLETVHETSPNLPFVLYTRKGTEATASDAIAVGVTDSVPMGGGSDPFERLANRIRTAVKQHRTRTTVTTAKQRLETITENTIEVLWEFTADWTELLFVNSAYEEIWGRSTDELRAHPTSFLEGVHPDDRPLVTDAMDRLSDGEAVDIEFRVNADEDFERWVWVQGEPVFDDTGEVTKVVGFARDITERKHRERTLKELNNIATEITSYETREAVCQRTVQAAKTVLNFDRCVISLEQNGNLVPTVKSADLGSEETTTMPTEEGLLGKTYRTSESYLIDDVQNHETAQPQGPYRSVISIPIGDHGVFQATCKEVGVFDEADLELGEVLFSHTRGALDRLAHEADLKRQNERLDEFASIVAHDLRNPLNVAELRTDLAKENRESEHLDAVENALARSQALIDDLLTLARDGRQVTEKQPVDIGDMSDECWRTVETVDATLVTDTDQTIRADQSRFQQLLENLFRNAIDHGGNDVTITVGELDERDGFYVADDGPGIPEDKRGEVFDAGFSTTEDGTGFGLNIVQEIVKAHGLEITVTDSEDGGARFEITEVRGESPVGLR